MSVIERELARVRKLAQELKISSGEGLGISTSGEEWTKGYRELKHGTPYQEVAQHYTLPFPLYPFQVESVNKHGWEQRIGLYFDQGTGKTITAATILLFKFMVGQADKAVIIVPPILIDQWVKQLNDLGVEAIAYRGTPRTRQSHKLGSVQATVVSIDIFKNDFTRFRESYDNSTFVVCDEAHSLKNISTANYRRFRQFSVGKSFALLTGTPITTPMDAYAYISLIAPGVYRNKAQFDRLHIGEKDFFGSVISYRNLELIKENMSIDTSRVLIGDVIDDLPKVMYTPIPYTLDTQHYKLYKKLATEQLLILEGEEGGKIDATNSSALFHKLGQIINNWGHFSGDPKKVPAGFHLIDQIMEELEPDGKLIVFATYRMTNAALLEYFKKYNAVGAYGAQSVTQNLKSVDIFIQNPECRLFIGQPSSCGQGLDGLQTVCNNALFLEIPNLREYRQASSRLHRVGQGKPTHIRIAVAQDTLQVRQVENLLSKDETANKVIRNVEDLRKAIFGE